MIVVADCDSHATLLAAISVDCRARLESDLAERAVSIVLVKVIRRRVVSHENIDPPVPVEVTADDIKPVVTPRVGHARLFRNVNKSPVAVVAVQSVAGPGQ